MNQGAFRRWIPRVRFVSALVLAICLAQPSVQAAGSNAAGAEQGLAPIRSYISASWDTLTRSMAKCDSVVDPKLAEGSIMYLPADLPVPPAVEQMQKKCSVRVEHLPVVITGPGQVDPARLGAPGLLYLENSYVVPGGRFNEMYGWDSYFIIRGLLADGRVDKARAMVENFFFEIEHYGTILNANRTYFLTRSQPPFLTSEILGVYEAAKAAGHEDRAWLQRAYGYAAKDYEMWNREPHVAGSTGLSRYYDFGSGPAPEGLKDESGFYRKVAASALLHPDWGRNYLVEDNRQPLVGLQYSVQVCDVAKTMAKSECEPSQNISLDSDYYKGDRAMRESGFDVSSRFGPFGSATHHFAPVCLNSLLYKYETDMERISKTLGKTDEGKKWAQRAADRKEKIQQYLWDRERGFFVDYNFDTQKRSSYEYITTFYPLWAGVATPEQAQALVRNLSIFEQPGGLTMSHTESGGQWDYPYAWAPTQLLALEGLRRYGFNDDANRVSYKFLSMIAENFRRDGTIKEKYNAVTRSSETQVSAGYHMNVVGFGWTNGVFLELLHALPQDWQERLAKEQSSHVMEPRASSPVGYRGLASSFAPSCWAVFSSRSASSVLPRSRYACPNR
jgi:alpha,alpha-trehalase